MTTYNIQSYVFFKSNSIAVAYYILIGEFQININQCSFQSLPTESKSLLF